MSDIADRVFLGFITVMALLLVALFTDVGMSLGARRAGRECHQRGMNAERIPFTMDVACIPRYRGSDSLSVEVR